jgi:hypothetical protein
LSNTGSLAGSGAGVRSSLLVFLVLSDALRDHADGRVVETEEVSDCLKRVLVDAGGCVDPLVEAMGSSLAVFGPVSGCTLYGTTLELRPSRDCIQSLRSDYRAAAQSLQDRSGNACDRSGVVTNADVLQRLDPPSPCCSEPRGTHAVSELRWHAI